MLRTRLVTAAIALPAVLAAILLLPNWGFSLLIGVLGMWGLYEVAEMEKGASFGSIVMPLSLGAVLLLQALYPGNPRIYGPFSILTLGTIGAMLILILIVGINGPESIPHGSVHFVLGVLYVSVLFPYFALLRNGPNGIALVILMLLLVVCTDTGAYFTGRAIGRHKLAFKVSPGKTIEGAIGGIAASIIGGLILRGWLAPEWNAGQAAVFSAIIAILAIVGDLASSAFKRVAGVKDSGWIFPGHGGLLDRTCSLVFAAVFTYYYSR